MDVVCAKITKLCVNFLLKLVLREVGLQQYLRKDRENGRAKQNIAYCCVSSLRISDYLSRRVSDEKLQGTMKLQHLAISKEKKKKIGAV